MHLDRLYRNFAPYPVLVAADAGVFEVSAIDIAPIKSEPDYRLVLSPADWWVMNARHNSPEGDRLDLLVTLEGWERKHHRYNISN